MGNTGILCGNTRDTAQVSGDMRLDNRGHWEDWDTRGKTRDNVQMKQGHSPGRTGHSSRPPGTRDRKTRDTAWATGVTMRVTGDTAPATGHCACI